MARSVRPAAVVLRLVADARAPAWGRGARTSRQRRVAGGERRHTPIRYVGGRPRGGRAADPGDADAGLGIGVLARSPYLTLSYVAELQCRPPGRRGVSMPTSYLRAEVRRAAPDPGLGSPSTRIPHSIRHEPPSESELDVVMVRRVLTDGDVEAIAEATAGKLAEMVSAPGTFALVDARRLARDLARIDRLCVRARDRVGRDAPRLRAQGSHSIRSRPRATGRRGQAWRVQRQLQEIARVPGSGPLVRVVEDVSGEKHPMCWMARKTEAGPVRA